MIRRKNSAAVRKRAPADGRVRKGRSLDDRVAGIDALVVSMEATARVKAMKRVTAENDREAVAEWLRRRAKTVMQPDDVRTAMAFVVSLLPQVDQDDAIAGPLGGLPTYWLGELVGHGPAASLEAAAKLLESPSTGTNSLSAIGNAISYALRRHALLVQLELHSWSLTKTAEFCHLGSPGGVLRAIKDLGLTAELDAARAKGLVTRAWNKKPPSTK